MIAIQIQLILSIEILKTRSNFLQLALKILIIFPLIPDAKCQFKNQFMKFSLFRIERVTINNNEWKAITIYFNIMTKKNTWLKKLPENVSNDRCFFPLSEWVWNLRNYRSQIFLSAPAMFNIEYFCWQFYRIESECNYLNKEKVKIGIENWTPRFSLTTPNKFYEISKLNDNVLKTKRI